MTTHTLQICNCIQSQQSINVRIKTNIDMCKTA